MGSVIDGAVAALNAKLDGGFDGSAKFVIEGEGAIVIDGDGARASDDETDVTLTSDSDTLKSILSGDLSATAAFMSGKLSIEGDMGTAMKLGAVLT